MSSLAPPFAEVPLRPDGHWSHAWLRYWQAAADAANDGGLAAEIARATAAEALLAPKASPTFTGTTTVANLSASGTVSGAGFVAWAASPPAIGGTTPAAGRFTALVATAGLIVGGGYSYNVTNTGGTLPTAGNGGATAWNYTTGSQEVDYFNTVGASTPGFSHVFWQRTAGSATRLLDIDATGNTRVFGGLGVAGSGGPTWTAGTGAPVFTAPLGSMFSRTDGAVGSTLYVSQGGGAWNPVAGV